MALKRIPVFICDRCGHEEEHGEPKMILEIGPVSKGLKKPRHELCGECAVDFTNFFDYVGMKVAP